jgi:hypothetical protein
MREYVREKKSQASGADTEAEVLAKIAEMLEADRKLAERIHAIVKQTAPSLGSRTWCGMPAYTKEGQVVCFVEPASKFKARCLTLGFGDKAKLDEGAMWLTSYALSRLGREEEAAIAALLRKAISREPSCASSRARLSSSSAWSSPSWCDASCDAPPRDGASACASSGRCSASRDAACSHGASCADERSNAASSRGASASC